MLMKEKVELANQMMEQKLIPSDWIYDNIFHFSEDQFDEYRDLIRQDAKRTFRNTQIETEGNDPVESGKSYGTPHDLANLYGKGRYQSNSANVPDPEKYAADLPGRPKEKASNINTQDDALGKDRLGTDRMKGRDELDEASNTEFLKHQDMLKNIPFVKRTGKQLVFEDDKKKEKLLDESQIKE